MEFNFEVRYIHLGCNSLFVTWLVRSSQSKYFDAFRASSRCSIYSGLTAFLPLEKENRIRGGKSTGFTPPLSDFTHVHVHVYRHTRTRLSAHAHIRIHVAFSVHAKSWVYSLTSVLYAHFPSRHHRKRVFKNSRLQTRSYCFFRCEQGCGNFRGKHRGSIRRSLPRCLLSRRFIASIAVPFSSFLWNFRYSTAPRRVFQHAVNLYGRSKMREIAEYLCPNDVKKAVSTLFSSRLRKKS